jgi:hypothetical protein
MGRGRCSGRDGQVIIGLLQLHCVTVTQCKSVIRVIKLIMKLSSDDVAPIG